LQRRRNDEAGIQSKLASTFVTGLVLVLSASAEAAGIDGPPVFTANELGVSVTQWTVENGLPTQDIRALAQTPDAFIWCGTSRGLVRFDGVKFTVYDGTKSPALDGMEIAELTVDGAGRLWIVSQQKELVVMEDGVFRRLNTANGLPEKADLPRPGSEGSVWFRGSEAFYSFQDGMFVPRSFPGVSYRKLVDLHFGPDARVWAILEDGSQLAQIGPDQQPEIITALGEGLFGRFFRMQDSSVGLLTTHGVCKFHEGLWSYLRRGEILGPKSLVTGGAACEDPSGNLWIGTYDQGLIVWLPDGRAGNFQIGGGVTWIRALFCDTQGNVWIGKRDGLFRLRSTVFRHWGAESGMEQSYVHSLAAAPDGTLWFANGWELSCMRSNSQRIERRLLPASADKTWHVQVARDGTVWVGDLAGQLFRQVNGAMQRAGSVTGEVTALFEDGDGTFWVGSTEGLWYFAGNGFQRVPFPGGGSPANIRSITEDAGGHLNVLALDRGIFLREGESWRQLPGVPEPVSKSIETLHSDQDGTLWATLATHGFGRQRGGQWSQFEILTPAGPVAFQGVAVDDDGYVWLPSDKGLFRVRASLLTTNTSPKRVTEFRQFDRNDGLGSAACTSIAYVGGIGGNGRVWVGTQNGAAVTDLETLSERRERSEPPRTLIEEVQWDDHAPVPQLWAERGAVAKEITMPAGALRLRITYTATEVEFPEKATFQYRLLGLAQNWVQAGAEREATFFKLSPGRYQFEVRSANRHGEWSSAPARLGLRVLPAWWHTGWFRAGVALVVTGLLWLAYARRMRRLKREQMLQAEFSRQLIRSQEQERKRIAVELHDGLGQNLLVAKHHALMGLNGSVTGAETAKQFSDISNAVSEALSEARRISRALRPPELDRMGLTKALRGMVQRAGEASGIDCRISIEDIDGLLPTPEEINVYRLVQESMNNILKHSKARRAEVQVLHHPDHLELTITDDGQGFDVSKARDLDSLHTGIGLTGMEERTRLAGGDFEILSQVGGGTVVRIRVPVRAPKA